MPNWEYCAIYVASYRDGSGGGTQELLETKMPGAQRTSVSNTFGSIGLLNQLGNDGWELVDVEGATFYLKREKKS
jgi:hypothetical protein